MKFFLRVFCGHEFAIITSVKNKGKNKRRTWWISNRSVLLYFFYEYVPRVFWETLQLRLAFWAQQPYWQTHLLYDVLIKTLELWSTLLLLFSEGLFSVRPSHTLNDPPATPPCNVCFKWKMTKASAAAGVAQPALCAATSASMNFFRGTFCHERYCVLMVRSGLQWLKLGANVSNFSFSPSTVLFHLGHAGLSHCELKCFWQICCQIRLS